MTYNWGGPGYAEYQGWMKVSSGEKSAAAAQQADTDYFRRMMQTQFQEQQGLLLSVLIPQLTQWAQHPPGFGMQALAAMKSQALDTIGGQLAAQQKGLQQQFATQNMAGLGSGVQAALGANLAQGAAGQSASALQQIALAQGQEQVAQQQYGMQGLGQASQLLGQAPQSAGLGLQSLNQQFQQQYTMAKQGGFWSNMLQGVVGGLASGLTGGLTGGLTNMLGGWLGLTPTASNTATDVGGAAPNLGIGSGASIPGPLGGFSGVGIGGGATAPYYAPASVPYGQ